MAKYPEVQQKVQAELDHVLGSKIATMADMDHLPYTKAVICECMRVGPILPFSLLHATTEPTQIETYEIPSRTSVISNLGCIMKDPAAFENPEEFKPERHLKNGKFFQHPQIIPFGYGKRRCLGEQLAKASVALFFANMLKRFRFEPGTLGCKPVMGFTICPPKFTVTLYKR